MPPGGAGRENTRKQKCPLGVGGWKATCLLNSCCLRLVVGIIMIIIIIRKLCPLKCLIGHDAVLRELHGPVSALGLRQAPC